LWGNEQTARESPLKLQYPTNSFKETQMEKAFALTAICAAIFLPDSRPARPAIKSFQSKTIIHAVARQTTLRLQEAS